MDRMVIRPARVSEGDELSRLAHASKAYWGYSAEQLALWGDGLTVSADLLSAGLVRCAVVEGRIVGFTALLVEDDLIDLEHLWVTPDFIGRGIGRTLFETAASMARALGGSSLRIVSDPNARGFYEHMGAVVVGEYRSVPAGRVLPVLSLDLGGPAANAAR